MTLLRSVRVLGWLASASILVSAAGAAGVSAQTARPTTAPPAARATAQPAPSAPLRAQIAPMVREVQIDEARIRAHVIRPTNTIGIVSSEGRDIVPALKINPALLKPPAPQAPKPHLDVNAFGEAVHAALKDQTVGYVMQLRKDGQTIYTLQWNWAKRPSDGSMGWTPQRPMHVASVSKLITAMAMTRLLDEKGISYDAKIIGYLPTYWAKGPNINKITFRQLLTHTSGFSTDSSSSDYGFMKDKVAAGVSNAKHGEYDYENMNFGLCRILIAVINGNVDKGLVVPALADIVWDHLSIVSYTLYVQNKVFAPAGVSGPTLARNPTNALAYRFPGSAGWDSGDLMSMSGGAAWHMSTDQVLKVMDEFRRRGGIMSKAKAQAMLDNGFGVDVIQDTPAGKLYNKNGLWRDGEHHTEQSLAYFLPEGMELVLMANSPIGADKKSFRNLITQIYVDNIKS